MKIFSALLLMAVLGAGCLPTPKTASPAVPSPNKTPSSALKLVSGSEHCLDQAEKRCMLFVESDDAIELYASSTNYGKLIVDPLVAVIGLKVNELSVEKYAETMKKTNAVKLKYNPEKPQDVHIYAEAMNEEATFIPLMFNLIVYLNSEKSQVQSQTKPGVTGAVRSTLSAIKAKLSAAISSLKDKVRGMPTNETAMPAAVAKAHVTWHYDNSQVVKDIPIPTE